MVIKIFADGADLVKMREMAVDPTIEGFTTNPTLARQAGVRNYRDFCVAALEAAAGKSVSLEVLADDFKEMERQAREIASWGPNAYVKVPVTDTKGNFTPGLLSRLSHDGLALNVTAVFTEQQVMAVATALSRGTGPAIVSIFAGRIADAGVGPIGHVSKCCSMLKKVCPRAEMLWASPRQVYDAKLAAAANCDIITMTPALIAKLALFGKDLTEYSRETVRMFYDDATAAGFTL